MEAQSRIADDGPDVQGGGERVCAGLKCGRAATRVSSVGLGYCEGHATHDDMPIPPHDSNAPGAAISAGRHLGGPTDDHYARLAVQPIECVEAWLPTWDSRIGYHLGEAVAAIARCGTKGQAERDLRKASWLLERAADILAGKDLRAPSDKRR